MVERINKVINNGTSVNNKQFDPKSNEVLGGIFDKLLNSGEKVDFNKLSKATIYTEDLLNDYDQNHDGVFQEDEIQDDLKNYGNQKDGKFIATSFVDVVVNQYNKLMGKTLDGKQGERVEKIYVNGDGESVSYYNNDNKMFKREYTEGGIMRSLFEYPDDKTELVTSYEKDGVTVESKQKRVKDGDNQVATSYDKNGNITDIYESTVEKLQDGSTVSLQMTKSPDGKILEKIECNQKPDYSSVTKKYDTTGKVVKIQTMKLDKQGNWFSIITDGSGKVLKEDF